MVNKVTSFESSSGTMFNNERDAWIDDLWTLLLPLSGNQAIAREMAQKIAADPHELSVVIAKVAELSPGGQARLALP